MWLEKLGNDITSMSYDNNYYQRSIETLFAAARKKNFTPPEGYRGALPTLESPWDAVEFAHVIPTEVIGVDGSQVYPDSAEPLPWAYAHAMVTSPSTRYLSRFFSPAELIQEKAASGRKLIDSVRFSLELELAAHVAWEHKDNAVVLLDGPVLPPGRTSHNREGLGRELLDKALLAMDEAVEQGGIVAGFTPNGHARYLSNLLLATAGEDNEARQLPLVGSKVISLPRARVSASVADAAVAAKANHAAAIAGSSHGVRCDAVTRMFSILLSGDPRSPPTGCRVLIFRRKAASGALPMSFRAGS